MEGWEGEKGGKSRRNPRAGLHPMSEILTNILIAELISLAGAATQTFARAANTLAPPLYQTAKTTPSWPVSLQSKSLPRQWSTYSYNDVY